MGNVVAYEGVTNHVARAAAYAAVAHALVGQKRKYTGEDYITHPNAVAAIVAATGADEATVAAAYLHDVLEDTDASYGDLRIEFGPEVADLVNEVTDVATYADGNRATRKALDRAHLAKASPRAQTIKLADLIDNSTNIVERDPKFAKVYLKEKAALLEVLTAGDPGLRARAAAVL